MLLTTFYVDHDAGGSNVGASWSNAFTDLQDALATANTGDEIWVAEGTYYPTSGTNRSVAFSLKTGVDLYGGFSGTETVLGERDWKNNMTVLSGDIGTPSDASDNSYSVVFASGVSNASLDGFTVTAGNTSGIVGSPLPNWFGGGMFIQHSTSSLHLTNVTVSHNSAPAGAGGGMFVWFSSPALTNVTFHGNSAPNGGNGGGMFNSASSPTLTNVAFIGNSATNGGGGIYNSGAFNAASSPTITNVTFAENSATYGGGMYSVFNAFPQLSNTILWGNTAPNGPQIYDDATVATTATYSIVEGGWSGTGNLDLDPQFVRPASAGSDGTWGTTDDDYGDLRLQLTSPAIDAGDNTAVPVDVADLDGDGDSTEPVPFDLDLLPRFVDVSSAVDTGVGAAPIVDMGAFEAFVALPEVQIADLITQIQDDLDLPDGLERSLTAPLENALQKLTDANPNNDRAAVGSLNAVMNKLEAQRGKKISEVNADALLQKLESIIDLLTMGP